MRRFVAGLAVPVLVALTLGAVPSGAASEHERGNRVRSAPFTFYLTHYELLGDPSAPSGVAYSDGAPTARTADTTRTVTLTGRGGWDAASASGGVTGGGTYRITEPSGPSEEGTWTVTGFESFTELPGWWGIPGFVEKGWQGPPRSTSFSGFLHLKVRLQGLGDGVLVLWCVMPETVGTPLAVPHVSDGLTLQVGGLAFTDYSAQEQSMEGVMFYAASRSGDG